MSFHRHPSVGRLKTPFDDQCVELANYNFLSSVDEELRRKPTSPTSALSNSANDIAADVDLETGKETDVESLRNSVCFAHPRGARSTKLSLNSVLPAIELSWHDVTIEAKNEPKSSFISSIRETLSNREESTKPPPERNLILDNVYGIAYPGEVLAIMGASGAGKTSLLNILTQRNLDNVRASGTIRLNGYEIDKSTLRLISAYVQQDDLFIGTMTVIEHLRFMALLRMGKRYTKYEREKRINTVMSELGLTNIANSVIGWPHRLKGISGGERKRLAFASEIMMGPPVLFCDEPTSGLDAFLAQQIVQVLKTLAKRKNMTIIITIHQPSSQVFELFDRVCLMANGRLAFLGPINKAMALWDKLGYPVPKNFNPGDHFIATLAIDDATRSRRRAIARINKICDGFSSSETGRKLFAESRNSPSLDNGTGNGAAAGNDSGDDASTTDRESSGCSTAAIWRSADGAFYHKDLRNYKATWLQQFSVLTKRAFFVNLREPMLLKVRLVQTIFIGLLLGIIYFDTPIRQTTVMNINGLLFQAIANMNFMFQFSAVNAFCEELPIFMREHLAHLYRVDSYFLAKNIADLGQYVLYPFVFATILYWMSGFVRTLDAYANFTLSCVLIANIAVSIAYVAACTFGSVTVATAVLPVVVIPLLAFGGFYINRDSLPVYFDPLKYLSYFGYAYETTAISQWSRIDKIPGCNDTYNGLRMSSPISMTTTTGNIHTSSVSNLGEDIASGLQCYRSGADVLEALSFRPSNLIFDYAAMLALTLGCRLLAYIALVIRTRTKR